MHGRWKSIHPSRGTDRFIYDLEPPEIVFILMPAIKPVAGQRWVSDTEPEMGLGIIVKAEFGRVEIVFPAANEQRQYALQSAPLRRVQFKEGDRVKLHDGANLVVEAIEDRKGVLFYKCGDREVAEAELSDFISFSTPEDRLMAGQVDELATFTLRMEALRWRTEMRHSPVRGFVGGRVDLIPHQMSIAGDVTSRLAPRVLLADEVGLGKTIEAGLILHRLHLTGRADRVLIVVPEPLIHQWFVELLRRFNLLFSIFDEERCVAIEQNDPEVNPLLDSQLVLCSTGFLAGNEKRASQALAAGWNLLIVDEAHHLEWHAQSASPQYLVIEALAKQTAGVLLLTATPQQLGPEGHFARLRLLDPDRYSDLDVFLKEAEQYERVAAAVDRLLDGKPLSKQDQKLFGEHSARIRKSSADLVEGNADARARLIADLLDGFGIGRVMFRNTRATLSGFPERKPYLVPLDSVEKVDSVTTKVKWLVGLLKKLGQEKVLLICRSREMAELITDLLQREINVSCAVFHEGLTLLQRDRNAAYFAEEEGARILICSEIGSEGRNFQFAHNLVLFDLPSDPELLEQRIGRLDRIGQKSVINIYVPYLRGTDGEVLARWYEEGLNALAENLHGASEILHGLDRDLQALLESFDAKNLESFIQASRDLRATVVKKLERGHDRLLELASCRPERAERINERIRALDGDKSFEEFFIRLLDHFGVHTEDLGGRSYLALPGHLLTDAFPALPPEGTSVTFDRARALGREDVGFLTWDHPMVRGALDLLLGAETGNCAFGVWKSPGGEAIFLELCAVVETIAPSALHVDRFLPATPLRIVVDHGLNERTDEAELAEATLEKGDIFRLLDRGAVKKKLLPAMLEKTKALAETRMQGLITSAKAAMQSQLRDEVARLEDLREVNDHVRPEEIAALQEHMAALETAINGARCRVDAVRLVFRVS